MRIVFTMFLAVAFAISSISVGGHPLDVTLVALCVGGCSHHSLALIIMLGIPLPVAIALILCMILPIFGELCASL